MRLMPVWSEIRLRWRRHFTSIVGLAVGIALLLVIYALSSAYREATRAPLNEIGADVNIQRPGDVPEELDGVVFPCSAVTIRRSEVEAIGGMPGVRQMAESVLLWIFDQERFMLVIGLEHDNPLGPGNLKNFLVAGSFLNGSENQAVVDATYARDENISLGGALSIRDREYTVVGIVDSSRTSRMVKAHIYLPLKAAQRLAVESKGVQAVSPFEPDDVNVVFLLADNSAIPNLAREIQSLMGDKVVVATPESFLKTLGSLFAISDKFALATSLVVMVVTFLLLLKTIAGGIQERSREIAVLKCLGWRNGNVRRQLLTETLVQCLLSGIIGIVVASAACWLLSFQTLNIPIPWEMSPTPHFLPGGMDPVFKTVPLPVRLPWTLAALALIASIAAGTLVCAISTGRIARIKPSEVLRHE